MQILKVTEVEKEESRGASVWRQGLCMTNSIVYRRGVANGDNEIQICEEFLINLVHAFATLQNFRVDPPDIQSPRVKVPSSICMPAKHQQQLLVFIDRTDIPCIPFF